jgi:tetratricopeptide (TPR) repeat protein
VALARAHFAKVTETDAATALALPTRLIEAHPDYGPAHSLLPFCLVNAAHLGWIAREEGVPFGREHATHALAVDERDRWAQVALGYWAMMGRRTEESIAAFRQAVAPSPNSAASRSHLSRGVAFAGRHHEAIEHGEEAVKLGPFDAQKALFLGGIAAGRFDQVVRWSIEAQRLRTVFVLRGPCRAVLASGAFFFAERRAA